MKKKIIAGFLILFVLLLIVFVVIPTIRYNSNSISGEEWMKKQDAYLDDLKGVSENLDNITSLYLSGGITGDDYLKHLGTVNESFIIVQKKYEEETSDLMINDYTSEEKQTTDAVKKSYELLGELIMVCQRDAGDMNLLSYEYLAAQQAIQKQMIKYVEIVGSD